ncbi:Uncharacterised protein [Collinsella intestinalis]|nr:Uncharacterised protein [Collinsella intestinalis]
MPVDRRDYAHDELGHGGAHGDDREADNAVGQAHARGDLTGAVDEQVGAPDEESESHDDEEELQKHVGLS